MVDEDPKEYNWETGYEKTWEAIKESDEDGFAESVAEILRRAKRKKQVVKLANQKLGMMRHIFILLDCSEYMTTPDLKPSRFLCTLKFLKMFVESFFDQNPLSQMGTILMYNKRAEMIHDLAGNYRKHVKYLNSLNKMSLVGELSLQNGLDMALNSLKLLPSHASKEILIIMGSLTTCDPGDITKTFDNLKQEGIRCSVIGLSAELYVGQQLAKKTGGVYNVILDESHLQVLLMEHVNPPPAAVCLEASLIKMGFPHQMSLNGAEEPLTMCMCHVYNNEESSKLTTGGYYCPQCYSKYCELPVECRACGLTLVSAPHLTRSYHHLFPAANYTEINFENQTQICFACQKIFGDLDKHVYECKSCKKIFCSDCDTFVHETLHTCPGCATIHPKS